MAKLGTEIVHLDTSPTNEYWVNRSKVRVTGSGSKVQKVATRRPCGAVSLRCDAAQRDGAAHQPLDAFNTSTIAPRSHINRCLI